MYMLRGIAETADSFTKNAPMAATNSKNQNHLNHARLLELLTMKAHICITRTLGGICVWMAVLLMLAGNLNTKIMGVLIGIYIRHLRIWASLVYLQKVAQVTGEMVAMRLVEEAGGQEAGGGDSGVGGGGGGGSGLTDPNDPGQGDGEGGTEWGGDCKKGYDGEGDAFVVAIAKAEYERNCVFIENAKNSNEYKYFEALMENNEYNDEFASAVSQLPTEEIDISQHIKTTNLLGSCSALSDKNFIIMGRSIVLPLSLLNESLEWLGSMVSCASNSATQTQDATNQSQTKQHNEPATSSPKKCTTGIQVPSCIQARYRYIKHFTYSVSL